MNGVSGKKSAASRIGHLFVVIVILTFLLLPLLVTFLFSISTVWDHTILPKGYSFDSYAALFSDDRFLLALGRSFLVASVTVVLSLIVMVPTIFIVSLYVPKLERWLQSVVLMPFAVPGVVAAVGLIKLYSSPPFAISGTIWILIGVYFIIILPFVYQSTRNSLRSVNAAELMEAAEVLGADKPAAFAQVILPNIMPGIIAASLLSFSIVFGEFVLANMLVGGSYEVVQVYLYHMLGTDGHRSSATIVTFFLLVLILYVLVLKFGQRKPRTAVTSDAKEGNPFELRPDSKRVEKF
ncbi:ABC transporter permease subunit [Cohnella pontilimi]|uniref:ABC transporter permease subunit n=1 Tax=Cohnella pontilimi TaxID=2564100 RepID=A0A4U0F425_9BACL|nr:ABC transporter permease subunit [Cohnella pontilimi]TJY38958.1 ABC transporter permease subunit [Cohnella pontilimi]